MTTENNKLIAEFMGYPKHKIDFVGKRLNFENSKHNTYHKDWNWLMQVVEKIESILPDDSIITIEYKNCFIPVLDDEEPFTIEGGGKTKIEAVYNACLEFIKWYNENKN